MLKKCLGKTRAGLLSLVLAASMIITPGVSALGAVTESEVLGDGPVISEAAGYEEGAYVKWTPVEGAGGYQVFVSSDGGTTWGEAIDDELIRKYEDHYRADALGLAAGSYKLKVSAVTVVEDNGVKKAGEEISSVVTDALTVTAHDRSGFAFVNGTASGAYNEDGTLRSNAVVYYVTEETKDNITMDVVTDNKGTTTNAKGLQNIINLYKKGYDSRPLDIRFIGNITDLATMEGGDIVISGSGSSNRLSCGITFEGVGDDANINGFGIRIKNASNVEVRNLGFMNCDSSEGDNVGLQQDNDHIWAHNLDMFYGGPGGDSDQAKGDGSLDCKKSSYVTFSYNHFYDTGKSCLLGLKGENDSMYITYHHNWFDHSDSRHPRIRSFSVHIYNNYYDGNAKYGIGSCLGSSVFVENNYFYNCKKPMMISLQGMDVYNFSETGIKYDTKNAPTFSSEAGGMIKAFGNVMTGKYNYIPYGFDGYYYKGEKKANDLPAPSGTGYADFTQMFDAYEVENRGDKVPETVTSFSGGNKYNNFDTDSSIMYDYTPDTAEAARDKVKAHAGRVNGGDFKYEFDDTKTYTVGSGSNTQQQYTYEYYGIDQTLKTALLGYETSLKAVGGISEVTTTSGGGGSDNPDPEDPDPVAEGTFSCWVGDDKKVKQTDDGSFFTVADNIKDFGKDAAVAVGNASYRYGIKMDSKGSVEFTCNEGATAVFYTNNYKNQSKCSFDLDEVSHVIASSGLGTVTVENLKSGKHTVVRTSSTPEFAIVMVVVTNPADSATKYTLTLNYNYEGAPEAKTLEVAEGTSYASAEKLAKAAGMERSSYLIGDFYKNAACTEAVAWPYKVTANDELYAGWSAPVEILLSYNYEGAGEAVKVTAAVDTIYSAMAELVPGTFTRKGYAVSSLYKDAACTERVTWPYKASGNTTLYASWMKEPEKVSYVFSAATMLGSGELDAFGANVAKYGTLHTDGKTLAAMYKAGANDDNPYGYVSQKADNGDTIFTLYNWKIPSKASGVVGLLREGTDYGTYGSVEIDVPGDPKLEDMSISVRGASLKEVKAYMVLLDPEGNSVYESNLKEGFEGSDDQTLNYEISAPGRYTLAYSADKASDGEARIKTITITGMTTGEEEEPEPEPVTHRVTLENKGGVDCDLESNEYVSGNSVSFNAALKEGFKDLKVVLEDGNGEVELTDDGSGLYSFVMGDEDVKIIVSATVDAQVSENEIIIMVTTGEGTATDLESGVYEKGASVSFNASLESEDYMDLVVEAVDASGTPVEIVDEGDGAYSFVAGVENITVTLSATAKIKVSSVSFAKKSAKVIVGQSVAVELKVLPDNAFDRTVSFGYSVPDVALYEEGEVRGLKVGKTTITATSGTAGDTLEVEVIPVPVSSVQLSAVKTELEVGEKTELTATVLPENAGNKELNIVSSASGRVAIETDAETGKVYAKAVAAGSAVITATAKDGSGKNSKVTITVVSSEGESSSSSSRDDDKDSSSSTGAGAEDKDSTSSSGNGSGVDDKDSSSSTAAGEEGKGSSSSSAAGEEGKGSSSSSAAGEEGKGSSSSSAAGEEGKGSSSTAKDASGSSSAKDPASGSDKKENKDAASSSASKKRNVDIGGVTYTAVMPESIQYTGGKITVDDNVTINGVKVGGNITDSIIFAKIKYKNNKNVGEAIIIPVLKAAKGADKNMKDAVKAANKAYKTSSELGFTIAPRDISKSAVTADKAEFREKSNKWKFKLTVDTGTAKPLKIKAGKDFEVVSFDPAKSTVKIKGAGTNVTGETEIPFTKK